MRSTPSRVRRLVTLAPVLLIVAATLAGCRTGVIAPYRASDSVDRSLVVPPGTPVRVETFNGGIEVATAAGETVTARVNRTGEGSSRAAAEADRDRIEVTLELVDDVAVLRAVYTPSPNSIAGSRSADVTLRVPEVTAVDLVTSNGGVSVRRTAASATVRTSNGAVDVRGVTGALSVETSNGAITAEADAAVVDLRTSNGPLTFSGALQPGAHSFETSNGALELNLPTSAAFNVDATTSNGLARSTFAVSGESSDSSLRGTVGPAADAARVSVTARTSNGTLVLRGR